MSRITNNIMINSFRKNYMDINKNLKKYMDQLSSAEKFSKISEAPLDGAKALKFETNITFTEKYNSNADTGIRWLKMADGALGDTLKNLRRLRDMAVRGATESMTTEDRQKIKAEVDQIRKHLVQLGNTKYGDRFIFNGTKTKTKPYLDGDSTDKDAYQANGEISEGKINREVSQSIYVDINVSGKNIGESGFSGMFADIKQFSDDLNTGNTDGIQSAIDNIDKHIEKTLQIRSTVGARQKRLELTQNRLESQKISYTEILSKTQDTNIPETIMKLKNQENVYRAALATGARVIQPSLVDFLK